MFSMRFLILPCTDGRCCGFSGRYLDNIVETRIHFTVRHVNVRHRNIWFVSRWISNNICCILGMLWNMAWTTIDAMLCKSSIGIAARLAFILLLWLSLKPTHSNLLELKRWCHWAVIDFAISTKPKKPKKFFSWLRDKSKPFEFIRMQIGLKSMAVNTRVRIPCFCVVKFSANDRCHSI